MTHYHEVIMHLVYLNNAGITLLERQQYQKSMATFEDALRIFRCKMMTTTTTTTEDERSLQPTDDGIMMHESLCQAEERLSCASPTNAETYAVDQKGMIYKNPPHLLTDPLMVVDINQDDDCFSDVLRYGPALDQIDFLIRMNYHQHNNAPFGCYWQLPCAMLMHNYAVACKRSSEASEDTYEIYDEWKDALHERSSCLFHEANSLISDALTNITTVGVTTTAPGERCHRMLVLIYAIMVSMFISAHLGDIMYRSRLHDRSAHYYAKFQKLYRFFLLSTQEYKKRSSCHRSAAMTPRHAECA